MVFLDDVTTVYYVYILYEPHSLHLPLLFYKCLLIYILYVLHV